MPRYIVTRSLRSIPQLLLVSVLAFIVIELPAGGFVDLYFDRLRASGVGVSEEAEQRFRESHGLDRPLPARYLIWLRNVVFRFDFGYSFLYMVPVGTMIILTSVSSLLSDVLLAALDPSIRLGSQESA